ncbi:MAG: Hsp20/alpha crystallin family protein [bacterium]
MSIVRWDPFADMALLRDQVNRAFEQSLNRTGQGQEPASSRTWAPVVDIAESGNDFVLHVEVPGLKPEEIDIQIADDTLTIKGERKLEKETKEKEYVRIERSYGAFQRSFSLGVPIKKESVSASYNSGVLTITLPKAEDKKPKQIKIEVKGEPKTIDG